MDTLDCIFSRHSVRKFKDKDVPESDIHTILQAAMSGPSAVNCRPWQFLVTKRKDVLERMAKANGPYATPLTHAAFGVMVQETYLKLTAMLLITGRLTALLRLKI